MGTRREDGSGRLGRGALALAAWLAFGSGVVHAADLMSSPVEAPEPEPERRWEVSVGAYLWGAGLSGDVGLPGVAPVSVDASFGDILSNLDLASMAVAEVRYDRFGIFGDLLYTEVSASDAGPLGLVDADITNEITIATLMGEARVFDQERASVDLMAGGRLWSVTNEIRLSGLLGTRSASGTETWIDPMVGVKGSVANSASLFLTGWAMAGGFGVGSDFGWDLFSGAGYEFNDHISIVLGYRGLGVDYEDDGFVFDIVEHGPVISGVVRF